MSVFRRDWCNDATPTSSAYVLAKAEAEKIMRNWAKERDVRLVTLRPGCI